LIKKKNDSESGLRFYIGLVPSTDTLLDSSLKGKIVIMMVPTKKVKDEYIDSIEHDLIYLGTDFLCPNDCRGALLVDKDTSLMRKCGAQIITKEPSRTRDIRTDVNWGNLTASNATIMVNEYKNNPDYSNCKTLAVHFTPDILNGIAKNLQSNVIPDYASGIRIYFAKYPRKTNYGNSKGKNTFVITLTETIDEKGAIYQRDILRGTQGNTTYVTAANNGSRHPPGKSALLIDELVKEERINLDNCNERRRKK
jgi:hypothetical protein